jgi:hypothetical protein
MAKADQASLSANVQVTIQLKSAQDQQIKARDFP